MVFYLSCSVELAERHHSKDQVSLIKRVNKRQFLVHVVLSATRNLRPPSTQLNMLGIYSFMFTNLV